MSIDEIKGEKRWEDIARMMKGAIERKQNAPKVAILKYIEETLEDAKLFNYEPNWGKIKRDMKKIWRDNI